MNLLERLHEQNNTLVNWTLKERAVFARFCDVDDCLRECLFEQTEGNSWCIVLNDPHDEHINTYQSIVDAFAQQQSKNDNLTLVFETRKAVREYVLQILTPLKHLHDFLIYECECGDYTTFTACKSTMLEHSTQKEVLTEEPNTSLMYHKLFPDKRLLRELEGMGYSFQMGSGLKIYKKYYASTHRGSGPSQRRTLQSIVILKDGRFFRKVPKSKWVQLQDPSDKDSVTWGTIFMRKMLADTKKQMKKRHDALQAKRSERLPNANN